MAGLGRLNPQYYQSVGESTPQAQLPEQFVSNMPAESPLHGHLGVVVQSAWNPRDCPAVSRVPRQGGMRTLYHRGLERMPIKRNSADGPPLPWISAVQPDNMGPIRNCHFNDALFQAGYPGFNLGLSFKAPQLNTLSGNVTRPQVQAPAMMNISNNPATMLRPTRGTG